MDKLELEYQNKLKELKEVERKYIDASLDGYYKKIIYIKEFITNNGPCIDLTKVNAADRILFNKNYIYDDVCDPKYVDFIKLYILDEEDIWGWNECDYVINGCCDFEVDCQDLTDKSSDYNIDNRYLRNKTEYENFCSILHKYPGYGNFEHIKRQNDDAKELIDKVYNFIKKYPDAFKTEAEMGITQNNDE